VHYHCEMVFLNKPTQQDIELALEPYTIDYHC
jgi:hypothetical protein